MSLAHFTTGAIWIVFFLGAALAAPPKPSSGAQPKFEDDSVKVKAIPESNRTEPAAKTFGADLTSEFLAQPKFEDDSGMQNGQPKVKAIPENNRTEPAAKTFGSDLKSEFLAQPKFEDDLQMQNGLPKVKAIPENNRTEPAAKTFGSDLKSEFLAQPKFEDDLQVQNGQPKVKAIPENNRTEPAAKTFGADLTSEFLAQPKFEDDLQVQNGQPKVKAIPENNRTEPAAKTFGSDLTSEFLEEAECQNSWQRFMVDFEVHYASEAETQKRRGIFCDNWKRIQEHNTLYEEGKESYKKSTNQWSDLTSEELKSHNRNIPTFPPNMEEPGIYAENTNASEVEHKGINCQAAWKKFLVDFSPKYDSDAETKKRRRIFCDNWKRIQEHNAQYEAGVVSHKKRINEWSDLTFEEWKKSQKPFFAPNMETPGNKTEKRDPFPSNLEEPGAYVVKTTIKPEEPRIEESKEPTNLKVHGNKTEASGGNPKEIQCQDAWEKFLVDFSPKYNSDAETEKRRSIFCDNWKRIQEHNAQYEAGNGSYKKSTNQWSDLTSEELKNQNPNTFPPNMEEPGIYTEEINCQDAWEQFLVDFSPKYDGDAETEKRRSIFCDNWKRIQEHNAQYEAGLISHKKRINQWSDLTFEEWKKSQKPFFAPNMETPGNKTEKRDPFPSNLEEPGAYVVKTTIKPEEPRIEESKEPTNLKVHGNKTEASGGNPKEIQCQDAWEKFLADYSPKYENDAETKIRRSIFCYNWKGIQKHNALYESGKVPHAESISVWSDLTSKELQNQSPNILPPNLRPSEHKTEETIVEVGPQQVWFPHNVDEPGTYIPKTNASEVDDKGINCQDAWEKFLVDFNPKYENDAEAKIRHSIFCDNLKRIQEHNALYKSGKVTEKKSINQWSDLTSEELKNQNPNILPPNLRPSQHKREATIVEVGSQQIWFPPNMEEPGTYVEETTIKPIVKNTTKTKLPENKTEETIVEVGPQQVWCPPNVDEPGTYIPKTNASEVDNKEINCHDAWEKFLVDFSSKYDRDVETEKRHSIFCENWKRIQEHNALYESGKVTDKKSINQWSDLTSEELKNQSPSILPPNLRPSQHKREATIVEVGSQQIWFPPNVGEPGTYVKETTIKPHSSG